MSEPPCVDDETATLWVAIPSKPAFEGCSPEPEGRERKNGAAMRPPRLMTGTQTLSAHRTRLTAPLRSFLVHFIPNILAFFVHFSPNILAFFVHF